MSSCRGSTVMKQPVRQKKKLANHFAKQPCSLLPCSCHTMMPGYSHSEGEGAMDSTLGPTHANPHQGCGEATPKDQLAAAEGGLSAGQAEGAMDSTLSPTHPNPHQGR